MPSFVDIFGSPADDWNERELASWLLDDAFEEDRPARAGAAAEGSAPSPSDFRLEPFDVVRALRAARFAAWKVTPERFAYWREDVAQEVAFMVWRDFLDGVAATRRRFRWHAVTAARALFCAGANPARPVDQVELEALPKEREPILAPPNPLAAVCRARLQALWPSLTPAQRAGLTSVVGEPRGDPADIANAFGVSVWSLRNARHRALELLDRTPRAAAWARRRMAA